MKTNTEIRLTPEDAAVWCGDDDAAADELRREVFARAREVAATDAEIPGVDVYDDGILMENWDRFRLLGAE